MGYVADPKLPTLGAPSASYRLQVDENGVEVRGPRQKGLFEAKHPIEYKFSGTIPGFDPRGHAGRNSDEIMAKRLAFELQARRNEDLLQQAIFNLSQMPEGARLLQAAKNANTSFVFDQKRTEERDAAGIADFANNLIPLRPGRTWQEVALTIAHEIDHFQIWDRGKGLAADQSKSFAASGSITRAMEGNARVTEAAIGVQSITPQPGDTASTYKPKGLMEAFAAKLPVMAEAAMEAAPLLNQGRIADFAARVLPAFYREQKTLAFYDLDQMRELTKAAPTRKDDYYGSVERQNQRFASFMTSDTGGSHAEIAPKLKIGGQPYMHRSDFSLDSPQARVLGSAAPVRAAYEAFKTAMTELAKKSPVKPKTEVLLDVPSEGLLAKAGRTMAETMRPIRRLFRASDTAFPVVKPTIPPAPATSFDIIRMPDVTLANARQNVPAQLEVFASQLAKPPFKGATSLEHLSIAIFSVQHDTHYQLGVATVRNLVDSGLRAPVAAFPQQYICDLMGRLKHASEHKNSGTGTSFLNTGERKLVEHWKEMESRGIDSVFGHVRGMDASYNGIPPVDIAYAQYMQKLLTPGPVQAPLAPSTMPIAEMARVARAQSGMEDKPEAAKQVVLSASATRR